MTGYSSDAQGRVNWSALLPPDDVTGWLSLDLDRKAVTIDPRAAYPDPGPSLDT